MSVTPIEARNLVASVPHWHHKFEIYPGVVTPGSYDPVFLWDKLQIDERCAGKTILDIGASDGFYTRRMDMLGGNVTAVDFRRKEAHGFGVMEKLYGKEFRYQHCNVYDINVDEVGQSDLVLFLGVLYHLPDMIRAFHKVRTLCRSTLLLETHSDNDFCKDIPAARYYRAASLAGDITNFWSPNAACVLDMLHDACFDVVRHETWGDRLLVEAIVSDDPARSRKMDIAYGRL
jgi:tRNA (mo5U34)-methyltransferase